VISILEYFLLGIVFCTVINPLLDGLTAMILQGLEIINGFFKVIISKQTLAISKLQEKAFEGSSSSKMRAIGFSYSEPEEEEDDDE
jgi:hypothetical protein